MKTLALSILTIVIYITVNALAAGATVSALYQPTIL